MNKFSGVSDILKEAKEYAIIKKQMLEQKKAWRYIVTIVIIMLSCFIPLYLSFYAFSACSITAGKLLMVLAAVLPCVLGAICVHHFIINIPVKVSDEDINAEVEGVIETIEDGFKEEHDYLIEMQKECNVRLEELAHEELDLFEKEKKFAKVRKEIQHLLPAF